MNIDLMAAFSAEWRKKVHYRDRMGEMIFVLSALETYGILCSMSDRFMDGPCLL